MRISVAAAVLLGPRAVNRARYEGCECLAVVTPQSAGWPEELRPKAGAVAIRDVLEQPGDLLLGLAFGLGWVDVAVLDIAQEAAHRLADLTDRSSRRVFDREDHALTHCTASPSPSRNRASRPSAARAACGPSSRIRRSPSGKTDATMSTACSAATRVAKVPGESARLSAPSTPTTSSPRTARERRASALEIPRLKAWRRSWSSSSD